MAPQAPKVSIVVGTRNRLARLKRCVERVRTNVGVPYELVVVDGASTDGTGKYLDAQPLTGGRSVKGQRDLVVIHEPVAEGAARGFDKGFRAAGGEYVMWLNDDAYPLPGAVAAAVKMIERPDLADIGMIAFYHNLDREWNRLDSVERDGEVYSIYNVRGHPYANFGLLRRALLERLGFLDLAYHFCGWDPDLSLKVQLEAGLKVVGCRQALIYHEELIDERKQTDMAVIDEDNGKLFAKWSLPEKFSYPDPAPAYHRMLTDRDLA